MPRVVFGKQHASQQLRDSAVLQQERTDFFRGAAGMPTEGLARQAPEVQGLTLA